MSTGNKRIKVVYIISDIDKAIGFEWISDRLDKSRFDLSFILLNEQPSYLAKHLAGKGIPVTEFPAGAKTHWPFVIWKLVRILRKEKVDVIHTHMYVADMLGQLAGKLAGVKKRIYTRHSSNESRKYRNKDRIDRFINSKCTHILAISENVRDILVKEEGVDPSRIRLIHHGFDLPQFYQVPAERIKALETKYNPNTKRPVIGVIARYSHWKGIQYTIEAFRKLLDDYPDALLVLANAKQGDYKTELAQLLKELPETSYEEIVFEYDLFALYQLFDVYVHVPIDEQLEAFGQTYVEALAAGIPSVFTLSGVAREFIVHERNALVVGFQSWEQIYHAVKRLLEDAALRDRLIKNGREDVKDAFSLDRMMEKFSLLYSE